MLVKCYRPALALQFFAVSCGTTAILVKRFLPLNRSVQKGSNFPNSLPGENSQRTELYLILYLSFCLF